MNKNKKFSVTLIGIALATVILAVFLSLGQTKIPPSESVLQANVLNTSLSAQPPSAGLTQANAATALPTPQSNNAASANVAQTGNDTAQLPPSDGKETADAKKEILPPVGELVPPTSAVSDPATGGPPVEFLNTPNPQNTNGPLVSQETK